MVVFDTTVLLLVLQPTARPPIDPKTGVPIEHARERINFLIRTLSKARTTILIPTPVLAEILIRAGGATDEYLNVLNHSSVFNIADFDQKAAVEHAQITAQHLAASGRKAITPQETWAKMKFDWQIVAIAKVNGVTKIYADDNDDLKRAAGIAGIAVEHTWELPIAPEDKQGALPLSEPKGEEKPTS